MAELEKTGKMQAGSRADLGRVGIGVAVREGATAPDVVDARGVQADAARGADRSPTPIRELGGTSGVHLHRPAEQFRHQRRGRQQGGARHRRRATLAKRSREARPRSRSRSISEIVPVKGARIGRPRCREAIQLCDGLRRRDPDEQHGSGGGARLRRRADRARRWRSAGQAAGFAAADEIGVVLRVGSGGCQSRRLELVAALQRAVAQRRRRRSSARRRR